MLLHLLPADEWAAARSTGRLAPASLATEGFVHCCGDDAQLLAVANRFYTDVEGPVVVLSLDEARLDSPVRWEAPAHPDGSPAGDAEPRFPHVYGPIPVVAVVGLRHLERTADGRFTALGAFEPVR